MANGSNTLARIQGQGLVETAPISSANMQTAGMTPAGAALKGLSPDSAKMAGTPPAKINAVRMAMKDVGSRRLESLREAAQAQLQADTTAAKANLQVTAAQRLDNVYQEFLNNQITVNLNNTILAENTQGAKEKIVYDNPAEQNALRLAVAKLNTNASAVTTADIETINKALRTVNAPAEISLAKDTGEITNAQLVAQNLYYNLTNAEMVKAFSDAVSTDVVDTNVGDFLASEEVKTYAAGLNLPKATAETTDAEALQELLKSMVPDPDKLATMKMGDLVDAIQTWRKQEFRDVAEYERMLVDPTTSPAKQDFARENLRRLGRVGVIAADDKINNLEAQMQDGDTLLVDGQPFPIEEFFTEAAGLSQLKQWLARPEDAPENIRQWIEKNRDGIQTVINDLNPDLKILSQRAETLQQAIALPSQVQLDETTGKVFFGEDLYKYSLEPKAVPEKFKLLQQDNKVGTNTALLLNRLNTIGQSLDGKKIFDSLSPDQIRRIAQTDAVGTYITNIESQKTVSDFLERNTARENFATDFSTTMKNIGLQDAGDILANISKASGSQLSMFSDIFAAAGLSNLLVNSSLNIAELKTKLKEFQGTGNDGLIDNSGFLNTKNYFNNIISKLRGAVSRAPQAAIASDEDLQKDFRKQNPGLHPDESDPATELVIRQADEKRISFFNDFPAGNLPNWAYESGGPWGYRYSIDEWKAKEPRAKLFGKDIGKGSGWTEWKQRLETLEKYETKQKEYQAAQAAITARKTQKKLDYDKSFGTYKNKQAIAVQDRNNATQARYNQFSKLMTQGVI